jgi:hypothetical protein
MPALGVLGALGLIGAGVAIAFELDRRLMEFLRRRRSR